MLLALVGLGAWFACDAGRALGPALSIEETVQVPTRDYPRIELEEVDDEVVMRITATPQTHADGPRLADEVLAAVDAATDGSER